MAKTLTQLLDNEAAIKEIESHDRRVGARFVLVDHTKITVKIHDKDGELYTGTLTYTSGTPVTINVATGAVAIGD